jgi:hypothetical protein
LTLIVITGNYRRRDNDDELLKRTVLLRSVNDDKRHKHSAEYCRHDNLLNGIND